MCMIKRECRMTKMKYVQTEGMKSNSCYLLLQSVLSYHWMEYCLHNLLLYLRKLQNVNPKGMLLFTKWKSQIFNYIYTVLR
jgi:hypothetical protein